MKRSVLFSLHAIVWAVVILFVMLIGWRNANGDWYLPSSFEIANSFIAASWMITVFYAFYLFLFPRYFKPRKYLKFLTFGVVIVLILPFCFHLTFEFLHLIFRGDFGGISLRGYIGGIVATIFIGGLGSLFRIIIDWFTNAQEKSELEKQNFKSELRLLRYQLNPHFLFNTLNNIDVLIQDEPEKASEFLKKLSEILRFMLYESNADKILLAKEIEYIRKYIDLQKIRTSNNNFVKFDISGDVSGKYIFPMIFIHFIENAFKYATNKKIENAVCIEFEIKDMRLLFHCKNHINQPVEKVNEQNGLGFSLIKQRLDLLYKDTYNLSVKEDGNWYIVKLEIQLNEY